MEILLLGLYFLPTLIAWERRSLRTGGIFVINLFLGWTILCWILALAWAASSDRAPKPEKAD